MPQTVRKYWDPKNGRVTLNFNWDAIQANSVVLVTASEYMAGRPGEVFQDQDNQRFIGAANITVANIAPHGPPWDPNQGVTFVVNVDWDEPLHIVTDITVLDDLPEIVQD